LQSADLPLPSQTTAGRKVPNSVVDMAEIVNLRRARKAKARQAAETAAQDSRVAFGRTKAERQATQSEHDRALRHIEGHRRLSQSPEQPQASDLPRHDDD
jgi:hypothetical protein